MLPDPNGDDVEGANNTTVKLTASESSCIISILSRSVESFQCVHITIPQEQQVNHTNNRTGALMRTSAIVEMKIRYSGKEVRTHGMNVNRTAVNDWFSQSLIPTMIGNLHLNGTSSQYLQRCLKDHATTSIDGNSTTTTRIACVSLDDGRKVSVEDTISLQSHDKALATPLPNPYSPFCEVGCELFYTNTTKVQKRQTSSSTGLAQEPISLDGCRHLCDTLYSYNLSVGYNDLMEVARLECHDGCFIGWKRCQPGYYCSTKTTIISMGNTPAAAGNSTSTSTSLQQSQVGGIMIPCPSFKVHPYRIVSVVQKEHSQRKKVLGLVFVLHHFPAPNHSRYTQFMFVCMFACFFKKVEIHSGKKKKRFKKKIDFSL